MPSRPFPTWAALLWVLFLCPPYSMAPKPAHRTGAEAAPQQGRMCSICCTPRKRAGLCCFQAVTCELGCCCCDHLGLSPPSSFCSWCCHLPCRHAQEIGRPSLGSCCTADSHHKSDGAGVLCMLRGRSKC